VIHDRARPDERPSMSGKNMLDSLFGIIPLLDRIKVSIEQTSGTIPKASTQLSSVSKATESATVEILNTLDHMAGRIDAAETGLTALHAALDPESPLQAQIVVIEKVLTDTRQDSMGIAMALQVQDITSQQIAGVTQMIEEVRAQLLDVVGQLDREHEGHAALPVPQSGHFDSNAQYTLTGERQHDADEIIQEWQKAKHE
jgi:DNA-binding FrmR family transcriptional regulator